MSHPVRCGSALAERLTKACSSTPSPERTMSTLKGVYSYDSAGPAHS